MSEQNLEFTTAKRRKDPIEFTLDGDTYTFTPPKSASMVLPLIDGSGDEQSMLKAMFDWFGTGLPEDQHTRIMGRLRDPDDDLDVDTLSEVVQGLTEKVTARPTS